jgi:hypothetical protein
MAYQILVMSDVLVLNNYEAECIRRYVANGGSLYASGRTSHTLLLDVFGFEPVGETAEAITYITPSTEGKTLLPELDPNYPLTVFGRQQEVAIKSSTQAHVLATVTLPYTDPGNVTTFVSIHSNPPAQTTDHPAIISKTYGKGKVIWCSAPIEAAEQMPHRQTFARLIKHLAVRDLTFEADAPWAVEVVAFHQPDRKRYLISLLNEQHEQLPPIPVSDVRVRVNMNGKSFVKAVLLPGESKLDSEVKGNYVQVSVPTLNSFAMMTVQYR